MPLTEQEKTAKIERMVARRIVLDAVKQGYTVTVSDGEEIVLRNGKTWPAVKDVLFSTGADVLFFMNKDGKRSGWVQLIYGNGGWDVIADYTDNEITRNILKKAEEMAERYG